MSVVSRPRALAAMLSVCAVGALGSVAVSGTAGAVSATTAQLKGDQLRLEGRSAPGIFVIATSTTSAAGARAGIDGRYKIQASGFTAPDCTVTIRDGSTPTATVSLSGCTPSAVPVAPEPAPPTGDCLIVPGAPVTLAAGVATAFFFGTTGCNTTFNSGATPTPVRWSVVAGAIPTGMTGPTSQGQTSGNIIGTPSIRGPYPFTLQVSDRVGATDQETFTVDVA